MATYTATVQKIITQETAWRGTKLLGVGVKVTKTTAREAIDYRVSVPLDMSREYPTRRRVRAYVMAKYGRVEAVSNRDLESAALEAISQELGVELTAGASLTDEQVEALEPVWAVHAAGGEAR